MRVRQGYAGLFRRGLVAAAAVMVASVAAQARPMHVMTSTPAAGAVLQDRVEQYVVRFDGPVNHEASRLVITRDGKAVQSPDLLLDSAPEVLFARAPALPQGHYVMHWSVRSTEEGDASEGDIPFSVAK
jgi:methionine-rich copper-binding protein CopC